MANTKRDRTDIQVMKWVWATIAGVLLSGTSGMLTTFFWIAYLASSFTVAVLWKTECDYRRMTRELEDDND